MESTLRNRTLDTAHWTQNNGHMTQSKGYREQVSGQWTRNTGHRTLNIGQRRRFLRAYDCPDFDIPWVGFPLPEKGNHLNSVSC